MEKSTRESSTLGNLINDDPWPSLVEQRLGVTPQEIDSICQAWKITELALFGSILRDDFRSDSDIDILVTFAPNATCGLLEFVRLKRQLETLFNRPIDLLTKKSIEKSANWLRRQEIFGSAQVIYVKR